MTNHDIQELLSILGIDTEHRQYITKIVLTIEPDSIPVITITEYLEKNYNFPPTTIRYELIKIP